MVLSNSISRTNTMAFQKGASVASTGSILLEQDETLTPFQRKVYEALCRVPSGKVTTYKYLGDAVNCKSSQAIGQALKRNPHGPHVPCHRVVKSDRTIGGFGGTVEGAKIDKKVAYLRDESVKFEINGKVDPSCIYTFAKWSNQPRD